MMLCISAAYAVMRCLCVCLSRSWIISKRINTSSKFFSPSGSPTILVFPYQTGWRYSDGNPPKRSVECRWGRQKTRFWTNIWLRCIQAYSVVNCTSREVQTQSRDERRQMLSTHRCVRRPLFAQEDDNMFVTGSTLYAGDKGRSNPSLVITLVFCCRRTS